jgi:trk system potassium uptake protein TrkA
MRKHALVVGGFKRARALSGSLLKKGYHVTVINADIHKCQVLAENEKLTVIHGDGSKPFILEEANAYDADIVIALTDQDDDNLVTCQLCKKKFGVKKALTLITDPKKTDFFYKMGIDAVVCDTSVIAGIIEQQAFMDEITTMIPVGEGRINLSQVTINYTAPAAGRQLRELNLPKQVIIGCIMRGEKTIVPRGDTRILSGDILVLISSDRHEQAAVRELTGR